MVEFVEYTSEQRKHYIDTSMYYERYLSKIHDYLLNYKFSMIWQKKGNKQYLCKKKTFKDGTAKRTYLGERSQDTETIYAAFYKGKDSCKKSIQELSETIKKNEAINKILKLNRAPNVIVGIFRKLNELDLNDKVIVIGTNSLYCYEASCGVFLEQQYLSTSDIDLFARRNKKVSFLFKDTMGDKNIIDIVKSIDKTFEHNPKIPYQFFNKDNVCLEIVVPTRKNSYEIDNFTNVIPLEIEGSQWMENSRLIKTMIVADNGTVANVAALHPLDYAIYKNWLGNKDDRNPLKKTRDILQSKLVTQMVDKYMKNIDIDDFLNKAKHFKIELIDSYRKEILSTIMPKAKKQDSILDIEEFIRDH